MKNVWGNKKKNVAANAEVLHMVKETYEEK